MRLQSPSIEVKAILAICNSPDEIQTYLLGNLLPDHFDFAPCRSIFERISDLLQKGKDIPKSTILKEDPSLSDESQEIISSKASIFKMTNAVSVHTILEK